MDFKDLDGLKQKFVEDARDLVTQMENNLLEIEKDPNNNELIEEIFRAMHTLKGSSGMFSFDVIGEFTHSLENIYDLVRDNKIQITTDIIDLTFAAADHIRNMLDDEELKQSKNQENHNNFNIKFREVLQNEISDVTAVHNVTGGAKITAKQRSTYYIIFCPNEKMLTRGINMIDIFF